MIQVFYIVTSAFIAHILMCYILMFLICVASDNGTKEDLRNSFILMGFAPIIFPILVCFVSSNGINFFQFMNFVIIRLKHKGW